MEDQIQKTKTSNELLYPISINYGSKDWNLISALREFLANMLDTKGKYMFYSKDNWSYIRDYGKGLSKKDFVFGESTRNNSQIGQFGEGLKMALITMLRYNRQVRVQTMDFSVNVSKVVFDSAEVMQITFGTDTIDKGTLVICECNERELRQAADLFLKLRADLKRIDDGIYLPAGDIHVLGLKTASMPNLIFSYNFKDKSMTNRDRNIVDSSKLNGNIQKAISEMKNLKAIKVFIENIEKDPTALEYQNCSYICPENIPAWKKALASVYGEKICISSDFKSDLTAYVMGYKVLRNITLQLETLLKSTLGIYYSEIVAKNYDNSGLIQKNKIVYPISSEYCSDWTIEDAIREFISNAIDTGTDMKVEYKNGCGKISDNSNGIQMKHFIFGKSEGKTLSDIGQFGEGLKIASLVLARNNRHVEIQTVGYTYTASIERNEEFDAKLFTISFKKNLRKKGTLISFECGRQELENTKSLFCIFKNKKRMEVSAPAIDVFFDEPGVIYVNGLKTTSTDAVLGYNIRNKKLVNSRDRNSIDTNLLSENIANLLSITDSKDLIEAYLQGWKTKPYAIEYLRKVIISNNNIWNEAVKKIFKNAFIPSTNDYSNLVAKHAGYEMLKNAPYSICHILSAFNVPTADIIAKKYEASGILLNEKLVYPINTDYCKNWTIQDAIRELISNAIDTKSKISITYQNGYAKISDKGEGIAKKNLLFGISDKGGDQIGQFGEGLKMASLVLARNNRQFNLITKNYQYKAIIERDDEFNADVLVLYLKKSKKRIGTDITFACTEKELENAKKFFLQFDHTMKGIDDGIYKPGGCIYINGVYVKNGNYMFSYNLSNAKKLLSRDRNNINETLVMEKISILIGNTTNKEIIRSFMKDNTHSDEVLRANIIISDTAKDIWEKTVKDMYPKYCLASNTEYDLAAMDKGYRILKNFSYVQMDIFKQLGFEYADTVITPKGDEQYISKRCRMKDLSKEALVKYKKALRKYKKLYGSEIAKKVEIVKEFSDAVGPDCYGLYIKRTDLVYILSEALENICYSSARILGILIHEHTHRTSGASDRTREFENALTDELGRIAEKYA